MEYEFLTPEEINNILEIEGMYKETFTSWAELDPFYFAKILQKKFIEKNKGKE